MQIFDEAQQVNENQGPDDGENKLTHKEVGADPDETKKKTAEEGTDDADNDVADETEALALEEQTGDPASEPADDEKNQKLFQVHVDYWAVGLVNCIAFMRSASRRRSSASSSAVVRE
ncbi:MAG: hypothetical protein KBF26_08895 [Opitutaceae bacterium]|nr:hypothetical protein [Opitutaceae bacterium]